MYVISVKKVRNFNREPLPIPEWRYAQYDDYAGSFSTGYPIFSGMEHASRYKTVDEAKEWYQKNKDFLSRYFDEYDVSTLAIREVAFNTIEKLEA